MVRFGDARIASVTRTCGNNENVSRNVGAYDSGDADMRSSGDASGDSSVKVLGDEDLQGSGDASGDACAARNFFGDAVMCLDWETRECAWGSFPEDARMQTCEMRRCGGTLIRIISEI